MHAFSYECDIYQSAWCKADLVYRGHFPPPPPLYKKVIVLVYVIQSGALFNFFWLKKKWDLA